MDSAEPCLVSIVTPCYNAARYLPQAIESVRSQDYPWMEHIVVDGGSTDGTLEILKNSPTPLRYFTGKDQGPADAAHRGFLNAKGHIFAWLNADDQYLPGAVRAGAEFLLRHPDIDVVYGEGNWIDEQGAIIGRYPTRTFDANLLQRDCFICQPTAFIRAAAYRRCGLNPDVSLPFDYDLWIRMVKLGFRFASVPRFLANSRMHHEAKTFSDRRAVFNSSMGLLKQHYGYIPLPWVFGYTAYRLDGRDQFFQPLHPTVPKYLASLAVGLRLNPGSPFRFLGEWCSAPLSGIRHRIAASGAYSRLAAVMSPK